MKKVNLLILVTRVCMRKTFFNFTKTGKTDGELLYYTEKEFRPLMSSSVRNDENGRFEEISSKWGNVHGFDDFGEF